MGDTPTTKTNTPANPVTGGGDHDRVTMLSLHADGTPDQHNPEIIGDKDAAAAATREQFAQQAVASVDANEGPIVGADEGDTSDALIDARKAEHEKAAKSAEKRADSVVDSLHGSK